MNNYYYNSIYNDFQLNITLNGCINQVRYTTATSKLKNKTFSINIKLK